MEKSLGEMADEMMREAFLNYSKVEEEYRKLWEEKEKLDKEFDDYTDWSIKNERLIKKFEELQKINKKFEELQKINKEKDKVMKEALELWRIYNFTKTS